MPNFKCNVCTTKVPNDHTHYGAVVCHSCRLFFRRASSLPFACKGRRKACPVTFETRTKCKYCRLQKCFAVGMKSDLVDKTKRAIAAYHTSQNADVEQCTEKSTETSGSGQCDDTRSEQLMIETAPATTERDSSKVVGLTNPPIDVNTTMHQFSVMDLKYFQDLSLRQKVRNTGIFNVTGGDAQYMMYVNEFFGSLGSQDAVAGRNISKIMEREFELTRPIMEQYVKDVTCLDNARAVQALATLFNDELNIVLVFTSTNMESKSVQEYITSQGVNTEQLSQSTPAYNPLMVAGFPNLFKTSIDFISPWASSQDLESFFTRTSEAYSEMAKDSVLEFIFNHLLLFTSDIRELKESVDFQRQMQHLQMILFKYIFRKYRKQDQDAEMEVKRLLGLAKDIKTCSKIYTKASIITKAEDNPDLDEIDVQFL